MTARTQRVAVLEKRHPRQQRPRDGSGASTLLTVLPLCAFGLLLVGLARQMALGISDPDTLWHVLGGRHLWATWDFVGPDQLGSFTTTPWVMHQWLPDLALAAANSLGGLGAVAWLAHAARIALCLSVYVLCRRWAGGLVTALITGVTMLALADSLSPRPQLAGFFLLALTVGAWLRTTTDTRPRWWLVPLAWIWASSHGTWVIGLMVGGVVIVGMLADRVCTVTQAARLALIPVLSLLAALATPLGLRILDSFATIRAVSPYIQEWRTPSLGDTSVAAAAVLAAVTVLLWGTRRARVTWTQFFLLCLAIAWASLYMRTVAVGALIMAPLAARALDDALGRARPPAGARELTALSIGAVTSLLLGALLATSAPQQPVGVPNGLNPALVALPPGTVVYNTDVLGGWLMWAHPELRHTRDTRAELYGPAQAREYLKVMDARPGWTDALERMGARTALVRSESRLAESLLRDNWSPVGSDAGYVLLRAPGS